MQEFAAILLTADDLDPPHQKIERRYHERLGVRAHDNQPPIGPQPPDRVVHGVGGVAGAEDDFGPACSGQTRPVADNLIGAEVAD